MKKVVLVFCVIAALVALVGGLTVANAQGKGQGAANAAPACCERLLGTVIGKTGDAGNGTITLIPRGESTTVNITVNDTTVYRVWMAAWQQITFESIGYGDWVAVCLEDGVAKLVVLLEAPFRLGLRGNVTDINGAVITVTTCSGGNFTIDLTNAGIDVTGIQEGQPVTLTIGRPIVALYRWLPGLHLGWFIGNKGVGPDCRLEGKDIEGKLERFQERFEQKFQQRLERWQNGFARWCR
jgi:hypothetical protein